MIKNATAVKAKIKNKAGGDSDKSQIILRIYLMERLLERVSLSQYRDNFVLKGGLLVSSLVGVDMRSTMDVDTTVKSLPLNKRSAQKILEEIIAVKLEDGVAFRITKVQDIMEGHEYEGIRFMIECMMDKLKQTIKVDISTGDEITPRAVAYKLPFIIEDRSINLWVYNLETLLAEKLETIMVRAEANTRMRDFYDIHVLLEQDVVTIDRDTMKSAFYATCKRRKSTERIVTIDDVINKIADDEVMKQQWKTYRKTNYYVGALEWDDVIESTRTLRTMVE
ncbi:nucleotidyl transferase AbiEii/AbiGii toxin family protein [Lachnoanaerobaculum umeaense]|uniref:Nucleotidyl transferase AbiEii/AbiGii toxin family protein n=1 Tax=Lachnoanaerobaculum umeaense TaxID=617123 RepID=A0A385Q4A3_9FIRM|nr:nucleotidyl transferase AbiEii/AbiGii toxin family protein [Lachnoanaerobaculum umeaense]AYB00670.1 nucleotidyl transferase AbiEii/AbiGii toxin family protein [Lachnoanaerobaculum umeaense]PZW95558.1 putative nucleotidyltransferase component of viral defense system [Lachnoanaerobaculum umeaense]